MKPTDLLEDHFRLIPAQKKALSRLGLKTVGDLLYHFPTRYSSTAEIKNIENIVAGEQTAIYGKISKLKTSKAFVKKIAMAEATIEDSTGKIKVVWFNQPYIAKMVPDGAFVKADGKVSERKGELYLTNPEVKVVGELPTAVGNSLFGEAAESFGFPVYTETRGITSKWFYHAIQKIFKSGVLNSTPKEDSAKTELAIPLKDPIPTSILERYNLPSLSTALIWIHAPQKESDSIAARKRFAFEEIFFIQLQKQRERKNYEKKPSFKIFKTDTEMEEFTKRFPFKPTAGQKRAISDILGDMRKDHAMSRLLEGDVGSGKTAVAAATVYAITTTRPKNQDYGNLQTAYMAPTEILAQQHFESFIKYFAYLNISVALITGSGCKKFPSKVRPTEATDISRTQLLKWVASGEIPILIGTHALIEKSVKFKNLAYIIIDEQHRFGTAQRQRLRRKDDLAPHLLSMTATPIPRTLALTIYGDLDLTLLDEMPEGRKQVITELVLPNGRDEVYRKIREELKTGRQAYVICPRINEPDPDKEMALNVKSVTEEAERLERDVFPEYEIAILHSKMNAAEKEDVMQAFKNGIIKILVATSVVEVGVNVPNATVIVIEGAERFGLSQLHQLRGRVLRSSHQAYCYVFANAKTEKTVDRLKALKTAKNGFELAEFDLAQRGAGELYGRKQWGISDLAMEGIKNIKMVEAARKEATLLLESDPDLAKYPLIHEELSKKSNEIHFE